MPCNVTRASYLPSDDCQQPHTKTGCQPSHYCLTGAGCGVESGVGSVISGCPGGRVQLVLSVEGVTVCWG